MFKQFNLVLFSHVSSDLKILFYFIPDQSISQLKLLLGNHKILAERIHVIANWGKKKHILDESHKMSSPGHILHQTHNTHK